MNLGTEAERRFIMALGLLSGLSLLLFLIRFIATGSTRYWFIPENLLLAWLAIFFAWLLTLQLKTNRWRSWQSISLTVLWLIFLPNAFYVLTDFVHVRATGEINQLYDIVMMSLLVISGFILGLSSLFLVHRQLQKRLSDPRSGFIIGAIIFLSSFAIYLGRILRWNSWDIITNPSGIILDVSDRIVDPFGHLRSVNITGLFFVLIGGLYLAFWLFFKPKSVTGRRK